ncbi:MAG: flagellar filament capping protein FliD [Bdellovibrionales bacterium]|nr:flagellar filament capping protein FliD [Bdellovibrionales bacterium]
MGLRLDASGGQFNKAIQDIIEAESRPLKQMQARKVVEEKRVKTFQEFKTKFQGVQAAIEEVSSFQKFRELKVDLGDGAEVLGVTLDKTKAQPGTYQIEVEEMAGRTGVISNSFANPEENVLGMGYVVLRDAQGDAHEIFIDYDDGSLRGLAAKINQSPNSPFQASVIQDSTEPDKPWRLMVSAKKDGMKGGTEVPEFYFLDSKQDFYVDDDRSAYTALLKIDDFEIELDGNDVPDFIQGLNLQLKQARPGQPVTVRITEDYEKIAGKMKEIVEKTNGILEFINLQHKVDAESDTKSMLTGDTGLQGIEYRIRNLMHEGFPVFNPDTDEYRFIHMNDMGVNFNREGKMTFDEKKFQAAIERDFDGIATAITGEWGFAFQVKELLTGYTRPIDGALAVREQGMRRRLEDMDRGIERMERQLETKAKSLTERFARLQGSLQAMQSQQASLSAMGGGGGGNPIMQLLGG